MSCNHQVVGSNPTISFANGNKQIRVGFLPPTHTPVWSNGMTPDSNSGDAGSTLATGDGIQTSRALTVRLLSWENVSVFTDSQRVQWVQPKP